MKCALEMHLFLSIVNTRKDPLVLTTSCRNLRTEASHSRCLRHKTWEGTGGNKLKLFVHQETEQTCQFKSVSNQTEAISRCWSWLLCSLFNTSFLKCPPFSCISTHPQKHKVVQTCKSKLWTDICIRNKIDAYLARQHDSNVLCLKGRV